MAVGWAGMLLGCAGEGRDGRGGGDAGTTGGGITTTTVTATQATATTTTTPGTAATTEGGGSESTSTATTAADTGGSGSGTGASCDLGTPDHCGECNDECPGPEDESTARVCLDEPPDATCDIVCWGEFYDLNDDILDGCEEQDPTVQDGPDSAVTITLPDTDDPTFASNPLDIVEVIYADLRAHAMPPVARPFGREDWWEVTAVGAGVAGSGMRACLGITSFPRDNRFEVCLSNIGVTTFEPAGCTDVLGGAPSACVDAPAGTDAGGPYYVRVRKLAGTNTPNGYALFLQH